MMTMHAWSVEEMARRVAAQEVTAVEVAHYFILRVERFNPGLNAIVQFDPELVLQEAAAVDRRISAGAGTVDMPLAGVPFTVKDNLWVEGRRMTQGSRLYSDFIAPRDAWAVARMRQLGAVVLGITNCSEFACKGVSDNLVYGTTRHPADPRLTPGGSSGGAASALAAGLGLLALGTDAGGSVRRPAAHCGLVGLKPSQGIVPHPWGFNEPNYGLSVVGILARKVGDCAFLLDQLAAYDGGDAASPPLPVRLDAAATTPLPKALRIAWSPRLGCEFPVDTGVLEVLQRRIDRLRELGWSITDTDPMWPEGVREYPLLALQQAGLHALYAHRLPARRQDIDANLVVQIEAGAEWPSSELTRVIRLRERIGESLSRFFDNHDLLLCPTAPVTAWPAEQIGPPHIGGMPASPRAHAAFTPLFNYCSVPACSVPAGLADGLPVGLQVVAPRFEDARVMRFARVVESMQADDEAAAQSSR